MGYRSEVQCLIYGTPAQIDAMIARVALENKIVPNPFEVFKNSITIEDRLVDVLVGDTYERRLHRFIHLFGDQWKWYESYPDVQSWTALMAMIDSEESCEDIAYEFVRIGESDGDIERQGSSDHDCYLSVACEVRNSLYDETDDPDQIVDSEETNG